MMDIGEEVTAFLRYYECEAEQPSSDDLERPYERSDDVVDTVCSYHFDIINREWVVIHPLLNRIPFAIGEDARLDMRMCIDCGQYGAFELLYIDRIGYLEEQWDIVDRRLGIRYAIYEQSFLILG